MTRGRRYLWALIGAGCGAAAVVATLPPGWRPSLWLALATGLAVQGPLGWWVVSAIGTERFLGRWAAGIGLRFALVGVMGLAVYPGLHLAPAPGLVGLVVLLMVLLLLEGLLLSLELSGVEAR